jgi:hypothetical protein
MSTMSKDNQVNAVALHLQGVMSMLVDYFDALVGPGQHNLVLVVGAGDQAQYVANRERAHSVEVLSGLLARWKVDLADRLPGETSPAGTRAFELLLNEFQRAALKYGSTGDATRLARQEMLNYVGQIVAESNRRGI